MQDPSQGVNRELLPHCHLLSSYRFPISQQVHPDQITKWLLQAPKISRDSAPFYWTYLDRPVDGSIFLVWQPLNALGTNSASDGYVWAGSEFVYQMEVPGGYILETYHFRTGFAPGEPFSNHSRKRYRLVPPRHIPAGASQVDPSLFIVHYSTCEPGERSAVQSIPLDGQIQGVMQTRAYLHAQGQIMKRDFMLHDRANWPQIPMPPNRGMPSRQQVYPGPARMSQNIAYPPQAPQYPSQPSKRVRPNPPGQGSAPMAAAPPLENGIEEEEDTFRGDLFDQLTPREISYCRYKQNHNWMEEIFSSPYTTNQIQPVDLGLGKPGILGKLTEGIYEIPNYKASRPQSPAPDGKEKKRPKNYYDPPRLYAENSYVAKLDPEKAEEFRRRTSEHLERTNAEIEKLKAKHAKKMAKFKAGGIISAGEKKLRKAVTDPDDVGPEFWRLEGRIDPEDGSNGTDGQSYNQEHEKEPKLKVDDIVAQVEASLGRTAAVVLEVKRIQDGGLEERQEKPVASSSQPTGMMNGQFAERNGSQQRSGGLVGDTDMGMDDAMGGGGQAAGLLDQFHTGETGSASAFSSHSTPGQSFSTPQAMLHQHSAVGTPSALGNVSMQSPQHGGAQSQGRTPQQSSNMQHSFTGGDGIDMDVEMGDAAEHGQANEGASGAGTDDWIVVPPGGVSPSHNTAQNQSDNTQSANNTAQGSMNQGDQSANISGGVDTSGFEFSGADDMTSGFGTLGGEGAGDGGDLDLSMDLGMDDSAFGDAFHGVEGAREAEANAGGMGDEQGGM